MQRTLTLFLIVVCAVLSPSKCNSAIPNLSVNLDKIAEERWVDIGKTYRQIIQSSVKLLVTDRLSKDITNLAEKIALGLERYIEPPYPSELKGLSAATNVKVADLLLLNLVYEITAYCTSIVAVDTKGQIWHGRNFDYGNNKIEIESMKKTTVLINFIKNNQTVFSGVTLLGFVGVHTGIRANGFTVSIDERDKGSWELNLLAVLEGIIARGRFNSVAFSLRDTLEWQTSFTTAVSFLSAIPLVAPCYFIIGGISSSEGAVITRERDYYLDIYYLDLQENRWFVLETNYDRWETPPPDDDRRTPGIKHMNSMTRSRLTPQNFFNVMTMTPTCNAQTVFSIVMSAASPTSTIMKLQNCKNTIY